MSTQDTSKVIIRMIIRNYLRENPFGAGTKRQTGTVNAIKIDSKTYVAYHLVPNKSNGTLELKHKMSHDLRPVYTVIGGEDNNRIIVLSGIYTHSEYDTRFGWNNFRF